MAKILVVDDEKDIVRVVVKLLTGCGHEVATAADGFEALEQVRVDRPDAIILDLNLPTMDGFEVCRRLKADPVTRGIPIVMMTAAYLGLDDARNAGNSCPDAYVVKPFLREVIIQNVERLLHHAAG